jgi:adenylate cyclase
MGRIPAVLTLGNAQYDAAARRLYRTNGEEISIRLQTLKVLEFLIQNSDALQSKEILLQTVWKGLAVTDDSLVQCIREIRRAIGDEDHSILQTVTKRGYRLKLNGVCANASSEANDLSQVAKVRTYSAADSAFVPSLAVAPRELPLALAVLPFTSRGGDESAERFAKTFSGDLLSQLTLHPELALISRQASFALQDPSLSASEVSTKLQARYVVTGQVQVTEAGAQWSLEMLDGVTNQVVWSENQSRNFRDVQAEIDFLLKRIAASIQNCFIGCRDKLALVAAQDSEDPFGLFVSAMEIMLRYTPESVLEAQRLCALLVTQQPNFSRAWSGHAITVVFDMHHCFTGLWNDERAGELLAGINRAIELDRVYALSYGLLAQALCANGRFEEAQVAMRKAQVLAPGHVIQLAHQAYVHFLTDQLDQALRCAEESLAVEVASGYAGGGLAHRGRALVFLNRAAEGIENLTEYLVLTPGFNWARMALVVALEEAGEHSKAGQHYTELLKYTRNFKGTYFGRHWSAIPEIRDRYIRALTVHGFS